MAAGVDITAVNNDSHRNIKANSSVASDYVVFLPTWEFVPDGTTSAFNMGINRNSPQPGWPTNSFRHCTLRTVPVYEVPRVTGGLVLSWQSQ